MNIKYRQLKAFALAAKTLSFTEAADEMAVTQASFSVLIKELETDLGVALFERTTRRCRLTEAGQAFQDSLDRSLEQLEALYRQMKEVGRGERGRLVMAALPSLASTFLPGALAQFRQQAPNVSLVLQERKNEEIFAAVARREVELGFGSLVRWNDDFDWTPIANDRLMLLVPRGHPLDKGRVAWKELAPYPQIMIGTGVAERAMFANGLEVNIAFRVEYLATAVAMVRHGLGLTTLPSIVTPTLNLDGLVTVPITGPLALRQLGVARLKEVRATRIATAFVSTLKAVSGTVMSANPVLRGSQPRG